MPKTAPFGREARVAGEGGEAEVEDLHEVAPTAARREHDVVALQIAMDDAEVVGARERRGHLLEDVDCARDRERALGHLAREARARQVLHDQVELALLRLADVVDLDDVSVVDAVGGACLAQHPRAKVGLASEIGSDQLEGHDAVDEDVPGPVDDAHPALAEERFEPVATGDHSAEIRVLGAARS